MGTSTGVSFPVVFYDGQTEAGIGDVVVYPSLDFKTFQSNLSRKIGISSNQFSTYLADSKKPRSKIPITAKVDFAAVSRETDCYFLVVLKRSRRDRRKNNNSHNEIINKNMNPPANVTLLRRDGSMSPAVADFGSYMVLDRVGYEKRVRELEMEREKYLMNMGLDGLSLGKGNRVLNNLSSLGSEGGRKAVCEECVRAKETGREVGFHWCVYDAVTFGFRSAAGPIARPVKGSD
ncbi:hypothetical protein HS088_TW13G00289 [Tripterygium wilfordii]|uniref:DUF7138 domain-containing protein n=1 Tax=Tripterygium wilfordii TaxID=458696 RepID=A0A7J7CTX5_TRIWF|nr:hypothetical protein HS088_TW13G00289 [Tripterygium wilfordii]